MLNYTADNLQALHTIMQKQTTSMKHTQYCGSTACLAQHKTRQAICICNTTLLQDTLSQAHSCICALPLQRLCGRVQ